MVFPILLLRFPSNKSARCRDKAIVVHSLSVQEGQIQRPEHAAGRLEWHAIRQGHIPEIDELREDLSQHLKHFVGETSLTCATGHTSQFASKAGLYMSLYRRWMCPKSRPSIRPMEPMNNANYKSGSAPLPRDQFECVHTPNGALLRMPVEAQSLEYSKVTPLT